MIGAYMNYLHWLIFRNKMRIIGDCERKIGIQADFVKHSFPVQGLILLIYFFITGVFSGWLVWILSENIWISFFTFTVCFLIGFVICDFAKKRIKKIIERQEPTTFSFRNNGE